MAMRRHGCFPSKIIAMCDAFHLWLFTDIWQMRALCAVASRVGDNDLRTVLGQPVSRACGVSNSCRKVAATVCNMRSTISTNAIGVSSSSQISIGMGAARHAANVGVSA